MTASPQVENRQPRRIRRRRTRGWRMPEGAVYVGRPTEWGNPWTIGTVAMIDQPCHADVLLELANQEAHP